MIDIRDNPDVIETLNVIVSNRGTAEIKTEKKNGEEVLVVVETSRTVKVKEPLKR